MAEVKVYAIELRLIECSAPASNQHRIDREPLEQIHFCFYVHEFPKGCFSPICGCGWYDFDYWFPTLEAAKAARCERQDRQVGGAAGAVPSL